MKVKCTKKLMAVFLSALFIFSASIVASADGSVTKGAVRYNLRGNDISRNGQIICRLNGDQILQGGVPVARICENRISRMNGLPLCEVNYAGEIYINRLRVGYILGDHVYQQNRAPICVINGSVPRVISAYIAFFL